MKLINLQRYTPDELFLGDGILYFIDATGKDWYKSLSQFTKKYSLAIENDTGVIRSISEDASRLYPGGLTVVDVDSIPDGCDIFGGWVFDGIKIKPRQYSQDELMAQTEKKKTELLSAAAVAIAPLQDAVDEGIATEEETAALSEWKKYRVKVMRVEKTRPEWPTPPNV
ncbi:tail fiber assembly protein [Citrobacter sp. wls715]|uniref:tail fiber assembly protein n=1 Tax=Citrobacter TaxID=544 RepID=UPI0005431AD2|nr:MULTISPECIES: tail fiber assembly protein [Citrobacter]TKU67159.1 tail fiber assembly protein [Citrobacter sp. wls715]CEJ66479.1 Phage tail fiber assembly protein [Citrobacter pasteurii]